MLKWVRHKSPNVKENKLWKHRSSSLFNTMAVRKTPEVEPADIVTFISPKFIYCTKCNTIRQLSLQRCGTRFMLKVSLCFLLVAQHTSTNLTWTMLIPTLEIISRFILCCHDHTHKKEFDKNAKLKKMLKCWTSLTTTAGVFLLIITVKIIQDRNVHFQTEYPGSIKMLHYFKQL